MQHAGHGKQPSSVTEKKSVDKSEEAQLHFKEIEDAFKILQAEVNELKDLKSEMVELKIALESARSNS
jgi:hypothetical protein